MSANKRKYYSIADEHIRQFCLKHNKTFEGWLGEPENIAIISGRCIPFRIITFDLYTKKDPTFFKEWFDTKSTEDYYEFCKNKTHEWICKTWYS